MGPSPCPWRPGAHRPLANSCVKLFSPPRVGLVLQHGVCSARSAVHIPLTPTPWQLASADCGGQDPPRHILGWACPLQKEGPGWRPRSPPGDSQSPGCTSRHYHWQGSICQPVTCTLTTDLRQHWHRLLDIPHTFFSSTIAPGEGETLFGEYDKLTWLCVREGVCEHVSGTCACVGLHCVWVAQGQRWPVIPKPSAGDLRHPDGSAVVPLGKALQVLSRLVVVTLPSHCIPSHSPRGADD